MELPQDLPHENGAAASFPDLMNDPAFATNSEEKGKSAEDPDTCRICRGEGSEDEQLFYPCKCSGSIKFVHQACLVEWLSHSQKKYCELCKTPFRFTKLYDPNMPRELPAPLFMKQALVHGCRSLLTWLRFGLVAFVWLVWLPWSMRAIWRALFWLADGHWPGGEPSQRTGAQDSVARLMSNGSAVDGTAVSASLTSSTMAQSAATAMPSSPSPASSIFSFSTGEPIMLTLLKKAFSALFFPGLSSSAGPMDSNLTNSAAGPYKQRHPSCLSDVKFLTSLTPSHTFNNILIDTLEGQLITLLVVISFILVFLIREWVVQQQPMANIGDGEREAAVQLIANHRQNQQAEPRQPEQEEQAENVSNHEGDDHHEDHLGMSEGAIDFDDIPLGSPNFPPAFPEANVDGADSNGNNPGQSFAQFNATWLGADTFKDLWDRGNGEPAQVLRIIREEGREEELEWIATVMRRLQQHGYPQGSVADGPASSPSPASLTNANEPPGDQIEGSSLFSQSIPESRSRNYSESGPPTTFDQPWGTAFSGGTSPGDAAGTGPPQHDFAFNFPESAPNTVNPFESQPTRHAHAPTQPNLDENRPSSANTSVMNDVLHQNAESFGRTRQNSQADRAMAQPPKSLADQIFDWFWGDITPVDRAPEDFQHDEEHVVEDPALEAPFVPAQNNRHLGDGGVQEDQGVGLVAAEAGIDANDVDVAEEGDDLEGILELIGMQGPIFGLLQNGVFSALLISFTVAIGIWLPYLWGKIALVLLDNPIQLIFGAPMAAVSIVADVTLDTLIGSLGYVIYWASLICKMVLSPFGALVPLGNWIPQTRSVTSASLSLIDASSRRLKQGVGAFFILHESDIPVFSVLSHKALRMHEARITGLFRSILAVAKFIVHDFPLRIITSGLRGALSFDFNVSGLSNVLAQAREQAHSSVDKLLALMVKTRWINASATKAPPTRISVDADLAVWNTKDRIIAIIMGYLLVSLLGFLYLRVAGLISGVRRGQRIDGLVAEVLHQAGGVMKVIVIIGIEMIIFPLYCGSLLDVALLPIFDSATIASRIDFTSSSPLTSLFVHWFVGTCYMFHFALFVSMCRKIMRNGVLCTFQFSLIAVVLTNLTTDFIRDPDDPTFHPVRDVLERNIATQLRKIAFSALVYGALVIVCLGGVVWGLHYAFDGILPIHWSATVPVLEFPVDLLFYNFVMPLAIRSIKPSDGLHNLYSWWFRRCARVLRLSNFFFGDSERRRDEEGYHVRRTWWDVLSGKRGDVLHPVTSAEQLAQQNESVCFVRDGKYVRAPASDQVRIPKGSRVFMEVTEKNRRTDGAPDRDDGLHGRASDMFTKVYVPPYFRTRIAAFILLIWVFAAASGVGITIIPLVIGRKLMSAYFPESVPVNDIYALSAGLCTVGGSAYAALYCRTGLRITKDYLRPYLQSPREAYLGMSSVLVNGCRLAYVSIAFCVLLPSLFALLMELYVIVPMHTHFGRTEGHVIHFVQDWTLGVLYAQMAVKFVQWYSASRPAAAINGVFRDGWLHPNVSLATRALILPSSLLAAAAVTLPLSVGFMLNSTIFYSTPEVQFKVYRYTYPVTLLIGLSAWAVYLTRRRVESWRVNIRDDVYLIGERLHNFSEKRARDVGVPRRVITG